MRIIKHFDSGIHTLIKTFWGAHNSHSCHTQCILYSKFVFFVDSRYRLIDFVGAFFHVLSACVGQKLNILHCSKHLLFILIMAGYFLYGFVFRLLALGTCMFIC